MTGAKEFRHVSQGTDPQQPDRYRAIGEHLARDQERGALTLRGPDLAYWLAFAKPGGDLREWVMAALDARITATQEARLAGQAVTATHVCGQCAGRGVDGVGEACEACGATGFVCPICRGSRWLTNGRPAGHLTLAACPGCMAATPSGFFVHSPSIEARTIQRHLDRRHSA